MFSEQPLLKCCIFSLSILVFSLTTRAFSPPMISPGSHVPSTLRQRTTTLSCICIHCRYVTSCEAYHFVESKHEQPHMTDDPSFTPREGSPTIHVNIRTNSADSVKRIWSEHTVETKLAGDGNSGQTKYELSATTYEYDVVACADFVEEKNCWVNNMPEEIRKANPDFVPT